MIPSLPYMIKSSVLLAVFLLYYLFFLNKQTFFTWNRIYLLGTLMLSTGVPLFHFTLTIHHPENGLPTFHYVQGFIKEITVSGGEISNHNLYDYLTWLYIGGICFLTLRYFRGLLRIYKLIHFRQCKRIHKLRIIPIPSGCPVFSFFNYIFIHPASLDDSEAKSVFEHEKIHVRQGHSFDLLITEIICTLNWFNPLVWIYKKNIAQNHEYIADRQVVVKYQTGRYFQLLVNQAFKGNDFSFTNCFSCSNLKKRMIMMTKKQSNKFSMLNYIPSLFIGGILCTAFTCITAEAPASNPESEIVATEKIPASANDTSVVFMVVENMPKFNGDMHAWLKENLKYPEEAKKAKEEGGVFVRFIVNEDGTLSDFKIHSSSGSEALEKEALRVVKAMPAWIPGKQRGINVKVSFCIPITFKL